MEPVARSEEDLAHCAPLISPWCFHIQPASRAQEADQWRTIAELFFRFSRRECILCKCGHYRHATCWIGLALSRAPSRAVELLYRLPIQYSKGPQKIVPNILFLMHFSLRLAGLGYQLQRGGHGRRPLQRIYFSLVCSSSQSAAEMDSPLMDSPLSGHFYRTLIPYQSKLTQCFSLESL